MNCTFASFFRGELCVAVVDDTLPCRVNLLGEITMVGRDRARLPCEKLSRVQEYIAIERYFTLLDVNDSFVYLTLFSCLSRLPVRYSTSRPRRRSAPRTNRSPTSFHSAEHQQFHFFHSVLLPCAFAPTRTPELTVCFVAKNNRSIALHSVALSSFFCDS